MRWFSWLVVAVQLVMFARFLRRVVSTVGGVSIPREFKNHPDSIAIIVPVLNEVERLEPCLRSLSRQDRQVREVLVVDGGSTDGTPDLARAWEALDGRIRLIEAPPAPAGWNGKAWGLETGLRSLSEDLDWVLTIDADVRCEPSAATRVASFAAEGGIPVLSVACRQEADTFGLSLVHPSLLTTLVYRFGAPGRLARDVHEVQSNGQFGLYRLDALRSAGGFAASRDSICEDVTLARHLFLAGYDVGFFEGDDLARTEMYSSGGECLRNWPRSLSLRDRILPYSGLYGLLNIIFLQVLPLLAIASRLRNGRAHAVSGALNRVLIGTRLGILVGTRRAYASARWTYWFSPLFDPFTFATVAANLARRSHTWRGLQLVPATTQPERRKGTYTRCV